MGNNIVEYHAKRLNVLLLSVLSFGLVYFGTNFMLSDDFRAGTIDIRRLRVLNDMPYEWRLAAVGLVVGFFLVGGIALLKFAVLTRVASVGDDGVEVITPWRVVRARWSAFAGAKVQGGFGSLLFDAPTDGSDMARKVPFPGKLMGVNTKAFLQDVQMRVALEAIGAARHTAGRVGLTAGATAGQPGNRQPAARVAPRRSFGRRSA